MITTLLIIANISGGILLGLTTLDKWDGESNFFNKIAGILVPFQTVIGGALIVLPILRFNLLGLVSIFGGLLLLTHSIGKLPLFGNALKKLSDKLMPFKAIIGIVLIFIALLRVF